MGFSWGSKNSPYLFYLRHYEDASRLYLCKKGPGTEYFHSTQILLGEVKRDIMTPVEEWPVDKKQMLFHLKKFLIWLMEYLEGEVNYINEQRKKLDTCFDKNFTKKTKSQ